MPSSAHSRTPTVRPLAKGEDWSVSDVLCELGPEDRAFEEQHGNVAIAVVLSGSFVYRSENGRSLMYPGSLLLGNAGACFECGHDHTAGDRCISFHFSRPFFEEIASGTAGSHRFRFPTTMLPALRQLTSHVVNVEAGAQGASSLYF
jgi:AraC family transcriptional regulator